MSSRLIVNSIRHTGASGDAVSLANDGTCTANITNKPNRNLVINGAFLVNQRGTSSTVDGFGTVDRFQTVHSNTDEAPTQAQADVASGTTPYTLGFRKSYKITNGNQTSGAGANDELVIRTRLEAQDIANCGWNYTSASSFITLSFWVKSSVAQNFYDRLRTQETNYNYAFETGSLSANTWTKITKTIPGNSNLQFDNDNAKGLTIEWTIFRGTDHTSSIALDTWLAYTNGGKVPDMTTTWYTTNDATFEITGVQLEVGDHATDFEHRSFGQEIALCRRYYFRINGDNDDIVAFGFASSSSDNYFNIQFPQPMRAYPTFTGSSTVARLFSANNGQDFNVSSLSIVVNTTHTDPTRLTLYVSQGGTSGGYAGAMSLQADSGILEFSSEL